MTYSDLLSKQILKLCESRNLSGNRLAVISGLAQSSVNKIISGETKNPSIINLHIIATTFDMTLSEFLDFDELNSMTAKKLHEFKREIKQPKIANQ